MLFIALKLDLEKGRDAQILQYNILNDGQHGFRAKRSCETQILTVYHELAASLDKKIQTNTIILDFSKAFDCVPRQRLLRPSQGFWGTGETGHLFQGNRGAKAKF